MTKQEAAAKIRQKHPQLSHLSDDALIEAALRQNPDLSQKLSDYSAPQQVTPKPEEKKKGIGRKIFDVLTGAEQAFGRTIGTALSTIDPETKKNRNYVMEQAKRQFDYYTKLASQTTDKDQKRKYLTAAKRMADTNGIDIFNNPEYQKTAKQIYGEALGTTLDVVTAGTLKVAGKAVKGGIAAGLAGKTAIGANKMALKAAGTGALVGSGYGVAGAMQDNASMGEIAKQAGTGAITGGVLAGGVSKISSKLANKSKYGAEQAGDSLSKNFNRIFQESTNRVRKHADSISEAGDNLGDLLVKNKIRPAVANERLMFNKADLARIEKEIAIKGRTIDEAASLYHTKVKVNDLKAKVKRYIASNKQLRAEGRVQEMTDKALKKIDDYAIQNKTSDFSLKQVNSFKKGMYSVSKKYRGTDVDKSDAFSELGHVFMKIVEDEMPDIGVKGINRQLAGQLKLRNFLESVEDSGGIVLNGGRLGKYFDTVIGGGVGAISGSSGGVMGTIVGAAAGKAAVKSVRGLAQKASILGPVDRLFIKALKKNPDSADLKAARAFIKAVKEGKRPKPGTKTINLISKAMKKAKINVRKPANIPVNIIK